MGIEGGVSINIGNMTKSLSNFSTICQFGDLMGERIDVKAFFRLLIILFTMEILLFGVTKWFDALVLFCAVCVRFVKEKSSL